MNLSCLGAHTCTTHTHLRTHTYMRTRARTHTITIAHAHPGTHARTRTHTRTHPHAHTHAPARTHTALVSCTHACHPSHPGHLTQPPPAHPCQQGRSADPWPYQPQQLRTRMDIQAEAWLHRKEGMSTNTIISIATMGAILETCLGAVPGGAGVSACIKVDHQLDSFAFGGKIVREFLGRGLSCIPHNSIQVMQRSRAANGYSSIPPTFAAQSTQATRGSPGCSRCIDVSQGGQCVLGFICLGNCRKDRRIT